MTKPLVIESRGDRAALRALYRRWFWHSVYGMLCGFLIAVALAGSIAVGLGTGSWVEAVAALLLLGAIPYQVFGRMFVRIAGRIDKAAGVEAITYSFSDEGISIARAGKTASLKWDSLKKAVEYSEGFIFYAKPRPFFVFKPRSASDWDASSLRTLIRVHLMSRAQLSPR